MSLCASILVHSAVLGVILTAGLPSQEAGLRQNPDVVTVMLSREPQEADAAGETVLPPTPPPQPAQPASAKVEVLSTLAEPRAQEQFSRQEEAVPEPSEASSATQSPGSSESGALSEMVSASGSTTADTNVASRVDGTPDVGEGTNLSSPQAGGRVDPAYLFTPEPPYPLVAQRRRQEGKVLLKVRVTEQGRPARVVLARSSGFPLLDEAAIAAVRHWEFTPARLGSQSVPANIEVPVTFSLRP